MSTNGQSAEAQKPSHHPSRSIVNVNQKEDFLFTNAYDQIKEFSVTLLRPVKPTGTDPFIAFETIFKGELVMGESGPYR